MIMNKNFNRCRGYAIDIFYFVSLMSYQWMISVIPYVFML